MNANSNHDNQPRTDRTGNAEQGTRNGEHGGLTSDLQAPSSDFRPPPSPIKLLIVEDSPVAREFLTCIFTSDPAIKVVGTAGNGVEALELVNSERPHVITMDIHMPVMDGFEATRRIMETVPTPIVIVSGSTGATEMSGSFTAIEAGALAVVRRPPGINHEAFATASRELIQTVKLMSEIKVVKRTFRTCRQQTAAPVYFQPPFQAGKIRAVAIGASTGGPPVLQKILSRLPQNFPVPVLIVQHIAKGFTKGFADWLSSTSGFPVGVAVHGEWAAPGHGYVAPDGFHMGLENGMRIGLTDRPSENNMRPSVGYLFRSLAQVSGSSSVGVLLTGMGRDGADELKLLKDTGAVTIAQNQESSVVHGMPGEAIKLGAAMYVLPPEGISALLLDLVRGWGAGVGGQRGHTDLMLSLIPESRPLTPGP